LCLIPPVPALNGGPPVPNQEIRTMNRYLLLHIGFEKPTPEIMDAWKQWFDSVADRTVENIGFAGGREITRDGTTDLPWGPDSMTGCSIIQAESLNEAEKIAAANPFISAIRVYEIREQ
jgi:hypothetical protein